MSDRSDPHGESGFTLLELLMAVTLLGVIMLPLAAAFAVGGRTFVSTRDRLEGSTASLFTSAYWADDVQSADTVTVPGSPCSGTGTNVVTFAWASDPTVATSPVNQVSYVKATDGQSRLLRVWCPAGGSPSANTVVARLGAVDGVTCAGGAAGCTVPLHASDPPLTVRMTLRTAGNKTESEGVRFSVTGTRRSTS